MTRKVTIGLDKLKKIAGYDPSAIGLANGNLFGLPFSMAESKVVVIPVPWEVTVSYGSGTAEGPAKILEASTQVDLFDADIRDAWKLGIFMAPVSAIWKKKNAELRKIAKKCIANLERGGSPDDLAMKKYYRGINSACAGLNIWLEEETTKYLNEGRIVGVVGGEHSVSLGCIRALSKKYRNFSVLHLDAHADLREAYEGFEFSHASIQNNVLKIKEVDNVIMAGVRDYSQQEAQRIKNSKGRVVMFPDRQIKREIYKGVTWRKICADIVKKMSRNVYVSFDIDVLNPALCPNTGTPVPGGFDLEQVLYLIGMIAESGRKIIGFDLCEVAAGGISDIDAIVGARALYRMANLAAKSQSKF